jgi:uncharacterized damage-inducible protein DinB
MGQLDIAPETVHDTDTFIFLLEYLVWMTRKAFRIVDCLPDTVLTTFKDASKPGVLRTLQHVYRADEYYFRCIKGLPVAPGMPVPETYNDLKMAWKQLHSEMLCWANDASVKPRDHIITGWSKWPLWVVVSHIVNHAAQHLAQVALLAQQAGYDLREEDKLDLILYFLERHPLAGKDA